MASVRIAEESVHFLADYAAISIAYRVETVLEVQAVDSGLGGLHLVLAPVAVPYIKDYDAVPPDETPTRWAERFDLTNWGILAAFDAETERRIGGAVIAWDTPGVEMLEERRDFAVLWDLRVHPDHRGRGTGRALFAAALDWARARRCQALKIETQNINVPACQFYARQGCILSAIREDAYPDCPGETQLIWRRDLDRKG